MPRASASEASPRLRCSGAIRRASATVQITGGSGHSSSARSNACLRTPTSNRALCATSSRPRSWSARAGSTSAGGGASSTIAWEIPVKRWMPRPNGSETPTSELQRSCSSPPPTSTAPTSVSSQRSFGCPFVSVSTATNSASASGESRRSASGMGRVSYACNRTVCTRGCSTFGDVRRVEGVAAVLVMGAIAVGCGSQSDYANKPRPPAPITVTAAIDKTRVRVSEPKFGGGPVVILISNQSGAPQKVTLESDELGAAHGGIKRSTGTIEPLSTGQLKVDAAEGSYTLSASGGNVAPATLTVGRQRRSSQNDLLLP